MEELKILVESIAGLPDLAIWVVGMYFAFKLAIIGSVYAVIRYVTGKLHDWAITKKQVTVVEEIVKEKVVLTLDDKVITGLGSGSDVRKQDIEELFACMITQNLTYVFRSDIEDAIKLIKENR